jgi:transcriptional regulator with XRE-family HTH domain
MNQDLSFGAFVRERRLEKGLTLRTFCKEVDLSCAFVSCMERDEVKPPSEEKLLNIAKVLSVAPDDLIVLAKRVPIEIQEMIFERPKLVAFLRKAHRKNDSDLENILDFNNADPQEE